MFHIQNFCRILSSDAWHSLLLLHSTYTHNHIIFIYFMLLLFENYIAHDNGPLFLACTTYARSMYAGWARALPALKNTCMYIFISAYCVTALQLICIATGNNLCIGILAALVIWSIYFLTIHCVFCLFAWLLACLVKHCSFYQLPLSHVFRPIRYNKLCWHWFRFIEQRTQHQKQWLMLLNLTELQKQRRKSQMHLDENIHYVNVCMHVMSFLWHFTKVRTFFQVE